jgi:hypothetical protein
MVVVRVTFVDAKGHIVEDQVVTARSSDGHTIEGNHGVLGLGFIVGLWVRVGVRVRAGARVKLNLP